MRVMAGTGQIIEVCLPLRLILVILDCVEWVLPLNAGAVYWHPLKAHHLVVVIVVMTMLVKREPNSSFDALHLLRSSASSSSHRKYGGLIYL